MKNLRSALILPVVLFILVLVALLAAMFSFQVHADVAASRASSFRDEARRAAEAGIQRALMLLRTDRLDIPRWYNNPDELHRIAVWAHGENPSVLGTNEEFGDGAMVYRFSVVADDPADDEDRIRIGVTDEASRLNLNTATPEQLLTLVRFASSHDTEVDPVAIVDAIIDWRDPDAHPRGEFTDTEGDYYRDLDQPYRVRNGPFDTVEELLLVKGVTGKLLYGEDFDRNGLLTANEDDGDLSYPPDNQDGVLDRGLAPYLTVYSMETDVGVDNRRRIYLYSPDRETVRAQLSELFPDEPAVVNFIVGATDTQKPQGSGQSKKKDDQDGESGEFGGPGQQDQPGPGSGSPPTDTTGTSGSAPEDKSGPRQQIRPSSPGEPKDPSGDPGSGDSGESARSPASPSGSGGAGQGSNRNRLKSPAELLLPQKINGDEIPSPLGLQHLPWLLDQTTVHSPEEGGVRGLINVNTAEPVVLRLLPGLTEEQVQAIVETRSEVHPDDLSTTAWLVVHEILDMNAFLEVAPLMTARAQQFTIESLGYADHLGVMVRLKVIVDFVGPIARIVYYRDETQLGGRFPIRYEDRERVRLQ